MTTRTPGARDVLERLFKWIEHQVDHGVDGDTPVTFDNLHAMFYDVAATIPEPGAAGEDIKPGEIGTAFDRWWGPRKGDAIPQTITLDAFRAGYEAGRQRTSQEGGE